MKIFLFFLLLICSRPTIGQTYVFIPDANFRNYLQSTIPAAMSGNSLNITSTLVTNSAPTMNVSYKNITDLNGIQFFTSLVSLYCGHNSLTGLPPLPNSLTLLECTYNSLNNLPVLPGSLQYLSCGNNSLTSLPALPNSLTYLNCRYNSLNNLPALPNSIKYIFCEYNSLASLPNLPGSLLSLWCGNNSVTSLPLLPSSLQQLLCYSNSLTTMPSLPDSLQSLNCGFNNITCFPRFPNSLTQVLIDTNPYNCLPNFVLPAMNNYTNTPMCAAGNTNNCAVVGIKKISSNGYQINIFPNPAIGRLTIETTSTEKQTVKLFDLDGGLLFSNELNGKTNFDVSALSEGIYNLTVETGDNIVNKKLIIIR